MSATKELKQRAAMALQALRRGDQPEAERLLEADAKGFMPREPINLELPWEVSDLQKAFQNMRRKAGSIPAAMCIVAPMPGKPGAFRFHFSGHDAVVALLQGKAGLKVSPTPPALDANGIKIPPPAENPEIKNEPFTPPELQDIDKGLDDAARKEIETPVDEFAAKRAEQAKENPAQ